MCVLFSACVAVHHYYMHIHMHVQQHTYARTATYICTHNNIHMHVQQDNELLLVTCKTSYSHVHTHTLSHTHTHTKHPQKTNKHPGLVVSADGSLAASISSDKTAKVFDVLNFDMIAMLRLPFIPVCAEWLFKVCICWCVCECDSLVHVYCYISIPFHPPHTQRGDAKATLAIADSTTPTIHLYDMRSGSPDPYATARIHTAPVSLMRYNPAADVVVSVDTKGVIEYWVPSPGGGYGFPEDNTMVGFRSKLDTDLYALAKAKAVGRSLDVSPDGSQFSILGSDW